jgi:hypothetical protein
MMLIPILRASLVGLAVAAATSTGCDGGLTLQPDAMPAFDRNVNAQTARDELLRSLRQATSRFHSTRLAVAAGYEPTSHCVEAPGLGGMGYHWLNPGLIDPLFNPAEPEVVLYEVGPGGNLRLVAVEYIVIDVGQDRPSLGAQQFDIGGTPVQDPHWSLHVWLHKENPAGTFAPFNPDVSCSQDAHTMH